MDLGEKFLVGTSGYSFRDWVGTFYPPGTRAKDMFAFYVRHFHTVEVNSTFYRMPSAATLDAMARQTPPEFAFWVKVLPRINDGSFLFLQHMISKMKKPEDGGTRLGIVFNGSPLFTGDAGSGESEIRRWIIENDWLDAIIAMPDQLFYNTGIFTYIWIVTNRKSRERRGKVQLIDATAFFVKMRKSLGNKRNEIGDGRDGKPDHIADLTRVYGEFKHDDARAVRSNGETKTIVVSKVFDNADFGYRKITIERSLLLRFLVTPEGLDALREATPF